MELRQLEYFIAIAETGAFSRAAVRLRVGQPILSRQIKALEQELGIELYHRTGRGIVLVTAPLLTDELFLLGPVDDPAGAGTGNVAASRLARIPLILPSRPHGLRVLVDDFLSGIGVAPNVQVEIDAIPSTLSLVESGIGYTILSYSSVHHLIEAGRIRYWPIVDPTMTRSLVVATPAPEVR